MKKNKYKMWKEHSVLFIARMTLLIVGMILALTSKGDRYLFGVLMGINITVCTHICVPFIVQLQNDYKINKVLKRVSELRKEMEK